MQGEVQPGYSKRACSFIDQRLLVPAWTQPGYVKLHFASLLVAVVAI